MRKIIFLIFLFLAAGWDLRTRKIPVWVYILGGLLILPLRLYDMIILHRLAEAGSMFLSMGIGAVLLFLSLLSREAIGKGDGVFFLVSGMYLNYQENAYLFLGGLLLCSICCLIMAAWGQFHQKKLWTQTVPFLPFLVPAGIWLMVCI